MSAGPNPVDRLEQAATQFKDSGVIQLAVQGLLLEGVARDLRRCDAATVCFASMFVRQVRQCFSAVWADGFPRCRHRFPVM